MKVSNKRKNMLSGNFPVSIPLISGTPYQKKTEFRLAQPLYSENLLGAVEIHEGALPRRSCPLEPTYAPLTGSKTVIGAKKNRALYPLKYDLKNTYFLIELTE